MEKLSMSFKDINPNLRYINLLQCESNFVEGPRCIYDYQLIYIHRGKGKMAINDVMYSAISGDLFIISPGMAHTYYADLVEPYLISGIHFDFTCNQRHLQFPIGSFDVARFDSGLIPEFVEFTDLKEFPHKISFFTDDKVRQLVLNIVNEFKNARIFSKEYTDGQLKTLLAIVARNMTTQILNQHGHIGKETVIDEVINYIHEHFCEDIPNKVIAERFHFHPNYLNELMVLYTGVSLRQYWIDVRIKTAMNLLVNTGLSVSDTANSVGYPDVHYFCRIFKKKTGMPPGKVKSNMY